MMYEIFTTYFYSEQFYEKCNWDDNFEGWKKWALIFVSVGLQTFTTLASVITGIVLAYSNNSTLVYKLLNGFVIIGLVVMNAFLTKLTKSDIRFIKEKLKEHEALHAVHVARLSDHDALHAVHVARDDEQDVRLSDHDVRLSDHDVRLSDHDALHTVHVARDDDHDARLSDHDARLSDHDARLSDHDALHAVHVTRDDEQDARLSENTRRWNDVSGATFMEYAREVLLKRDESESNS